MELYAEGSRDEFLTNNSHSGHVAHIEFLGPINGTSYYVDDDGNMTGNLSTHHQAIPPPPHFTEQNLIKVIVFSCIAVVSFVGNTATVVQMVRMRRRKSTINTLILHLAIADLIVTFFNLVNDAVWNYTVQWYGGDILCKLNKYLQVFGLYASTYILVAISLDRCLAILDPMGRNQAPQRVRIMVTIAWILSACFSLPQMVIFRVKEGPFVEPFIQCVTKGAYPEPWQEPLYTCVSILLLFIIPLVTMSTAYLLIFCTIAKKSKDLQKESESANTEMLAQGPVRSQLFRKAKVKSLQMTALIVVAFIVCWTPYYVLFIIYTFFEEALAETAKQYSVWIFFCGVGNSMVNPMIYGAFHICNRRRRRTPRVKFNGIYRDAGGPHCQVTSGRGGEPGVRGSSHLAPGGSSGASKMSSSSRTPGPQAAQYHHINCCLGHANGTDHFAPAAAGRQCCTDNGHTQHSMQASYHAAEKNMVT